MERNAEMIWLMLAGECDMFARALNTVQEVLFTCVVVLWCCASSVGRAVAQLVEALRGRGFDSQFQSIFGLIQPLTEMSTRNISWG